MSLALSLSILPINISKESVWLQLPLHLAHSLLSLIIEETLNRNISSLTLQNSNALSVRSPSHSDCLQIWGVLLPVLLFEDGLPSFKGD